MNHSEASNRFHASSSVVHPEVHLVHPFHLLKKIGVVLSEFLTRKRKSGTLLETVRREVFQLTGEKIGKVLFALLFSFLLHEKYNKEFVGL